MRLFAEKRISSVHDSGLSSWRDLGAHVHQYPHFFITLYENLAVPNVPGVQQRWEVYRQAPEETGVAAGVGTTSKSDAKTRGGNCLKTKRNVGWRLSKQDSVFDVFGHRVPACLSLSNTPCSLFRNKQDVLGSKKKKKKIM